jgi:hypothetical protein
MTHDCMDCRRFRRHIEMLRNRNAELELRLEGVRQRERQAAASVQPDLPESGCDINAELSFQPGTVANSAAAPVQE